MMKSAGLTVCLLPPERRIITGTGEIPRYTTYGIVKLIFLAVFCRVSISRFSNENGVLNMRKGFQQTSFEIWIVLTVVFSASSENCLSLNYR